MSARVFMGLAPSGKPHPTTKWSLLMALLVVVVLGVPNLASAGQPTVQPPTGPGAGNVSGTYYFTGTYSFSTYISCNTGATFNSSYANNITGTFVFYGASDGSLLVSINGGGKLIVTSCGNPFGAPFVNVASYNIEEGSPPPPPTPTPTPTPTRTPTPTPTPSGGGGGGGGGSHNSGGGGGQTNSNPSQPATGSTPAPPPAPDQPTPTPQTPSATPSPSPSTSPGPVVGTAGTPDQPIQPSGSGLQTLINISLWLVAMAGAGLLALILLILIALRSRRLRAWLDPSLAVARLRIEPYIFRVKWAVTHAVAAAVKLVKVHGKDKPKKPGLSHHKHSGKVLAHHHTSYPALAFLLLLSGVLATAVSYSTRADSTASSLLSLTVLGSPPSTPATIDQPAPNDRFTTSTITVRGTCPADVFVEIWRNGAFAGSTVCDVNNLYSVLITLVPGQNDLVARVVDALGQYGPDSATVTVFYDAPPPPTPTPTPSPLPTATPKVTPTPTKSIAPKSTPKATASPSPAPGPAPLLLDSQRHNYQGADPSTPVDWTLTVSGGRAPYHLTWGWGDGTSDTTYVAAAGKAAMQHTYSQAGTYQVTVRAKDALGHEAALQLVVIISGPTAAGYTNNDRPGNLIFVWPLLILASLLVLSFWLGERHKLAIMRPFLHFPSKPAAS